MFEGRHFDKNTPEGHEKQGNILSICMSEKFVMKVLEMVLATAIALRDDDEV